MAKTSETDFRIQLEKLQVLPQHCVFVSDDPRWDLVGPEAVGIRALLVDCRGVLQNVGEGSIKNLYELPSRLQLS